MYPNESNLFILLLYIQRYIEIICTWTTSWKTVTVDNKLPIICCDIVVLLCSFLTLCIWALTDIQSHIHELKLKASSLCEL